MPIYIGIIARSSLCVVVLLYRRGICFVEHQSLDPGRASLVSVLAIRNCGRVCDTWHLDRQGRQTVMAGYNKSVEKVARVFANFEDADKADKRVYAAMSSEDRLNIVIELRDRRHPHAAEQRLARISRLIKLEQS
jgi:hypothetical protein